MPTMNTHYKVRNLKGTSGRKLPGQSWIGMWRQKTGSTRTTCARLHCSQGDLVGAHVVCVDGRMSDAHWIVPLCRSCNSRGANLGEFFIDSRTTLITANRTTLAAWDFDV